jgi:inward rectifier potassium channel
MNTTPPQTDNQAADLGFGSRVSEQSRGRFLNRDGSFNVVRTGLSYLESLSPYHALLTISWTRFYIVLLLSYVAFNILFAGCYFLCGPGALQGATGVTDGARYLDDFFFSIQTSTTIGYGRISPVGVPANILVCIEAMFGLLGFALATSLLFARFSKPEAKIIFSRQAVVAPYRGITALEFRIANGRRNQLIQVEATVTLALREVRSRQQRVFHPLKLERDRVVFFPLNWTIVHPIDEQSPLFGITREQFYASDPELLILLSGVDETFSQTVHARSSYKGNEIVWGAKFADMYLPASDGAVSVNMKRLHVIEPAEA